MLCRRDNRKACCTRGVLVVLLTCCFLFLLLYFFTYNLSFFDIPSLGFDERSARETLWSEKWLTTYRHKVHEYLNSLYIFRFSWTAQNTWPNLMIIHTWFRGLGQVSDVLKPLCVGVYGIRIKLALQRKHKGSKENTFIKKSHFDFFYIASCSFHLCRTFGPFIREKIRHVLHKTRPK